MRVGRGTKILTEEARRGCMSSVSDSNHNTHYRVEISLLESNGILFVEQTVFNVNNNEMCSFYKISLYKRVPLASTRAKERTTRMVRDVSNLLRCKNIGVDVINFFYSVEDI